MAKPKSDRGHQLTDQMLTDLEKRLHDEYEKAAKEIQLKLDYYMKRFRTKDKIWQKWVDKGVKTQEEYQEWRIGQLAMGERWEKMKDSIVSDQTNANRIARQITNREMPSIFALNANYAIYQAEHDARIDTSLTLYNREAVDRILREDPDLLLPPGKKVSQQIKTKKAVRWEKQKIQSVMMQGIMQGESIPTIAARLSQEVEMMDFKAAVRNARTMATNAQNAGRYDAYNRLQSNGVDLTLEWAATLDDRTRHEHRLMHGQRRDVGEPFVVDGIEIMYPAQTGDFMGVRESDIPQSLIWNCRCTILAWVKGFEHDTIKESDKMGDMTFDEWLEAKENPQDILHQYETGKDIRDDYIRRYAFPYEPGEGGAPDGGAPDDGGPSDNGWTGPVDGSNITETWERRQDKFDFEIDDVLDAQGFDGKPRVVSQEEFDEAVKESGFVAQRAYSAPDQETLDDYRDQLYNGKWYVDCSTGGARHGQGMYCVADYDGKITEGMRDEANSYAGYYGNRPAYIETLTVDPSAKFIDEDKVRDMMSDYNESVRAKAYNAALEETLKQDVVAETIEKYKKYYGVQLTADEMSIYMRGMQLKNMESDEFSGTLKKQTNQIIKKYKLKDHSLVQSKYRSTDAYKKASQKEYSDIGPFAAANGYDGIKTSGREDQVPYIAILNRTKVIFLRED